MAEKSVNKVGIFNNDMDDTIFNSFTGIFVNAFFRSYTCACSFVRFFDNSIFRSLLNWWFIHFNFDTSQFRSLVSLTCLFYICFCFKFFSLTRSFVYLLLLRLIIHSFVFSFHRSFVPSFTRCSLIYLLQFHQTHKRIKNGRKHNRCQARKVRESQIDKD